ncbi:MAG: hypothetical protein IKB67_01400 [Clostridia bacterium]|nr:hypothetical protein [Clostridia bacterium]
MEDIKINEMELEQNNKKAPVNNKKTFLLVWKIIVGVLYAGITAFLVWGLIDALSGLNAPPPQSGQIDTAGLGFALYLVLVVLILGSCAYIANAIFSIIGLVVASKNKANKGTKIYFIVFIALPIITEIVIFLLGKALGANG